MMHHNQKTRVLSLLCSSLCSSLWSSVFVSSKGGNGNCPKAAEAETSEDGRGSPMSLQTWNLMISWDIMYIKVLCKIQCYPSINNYMVNNKLWRHFLKQSFDNILGDQFRSWDQDSLSRWLLWNRPNHNICIIPGLGTLKLVTILQLSLIYSVVSCRSVV